MGQHIRGMTTAGNTTTNTTAGTAPSTNKGC
jgi:hypothetical protein